MLFQVLGSVRGKIQLSLHHSLLVNDPWSRLEDMCMIKLKDQHAASRQNAKVPLVYTLMSDYSS